LIFVAPSKFIAASENKPGFFSRDVVDERVFFNRNLDLVDGVALVCGGREHCLPDYKIDRRNFPYFGLEWVASGRGTVCLNKTQERLEAGSFFLYGPRIAHQISTDSPNRLVKYFVDFTGPAALPLLKKYGLRPGQVGLVCNAAAMADFFDHLVESGLRSGKTNVRLGRLLLECLFAAVSEHRLNLDGRNGQAHSTYLKCRSFMELNFRSIQSVAQVAQNCHLDPAHLSRIFSKFSGESPHKLLERLKMNAAAVQLVRRNALAKQVAAEFGYADPYHFSKAFKRVHSLSPAAYREARQTGITP